MILFTILDLPNRVIISGDIPNLDYSSYTIFKAHITSIKQQKESFGGKLIIKSTDGQIFELDHTAFKDTYGFQNNTDLRLYLEALI